MLPWILFNAFVIVMLALDLLVFHRKAKEVSIREAVTLSIFWIVLALLFNVYIFFSRGHDSAITFFTGYIIEKSLSVDNLFVFLMIFKYFHTPASSMHKVLFYGVLGAIVLRALFIWLGIALIASFHWILYVFGIFLVYTGIKLALEKDREYHPEANPVLKFFKKHFPFTNKYHGEKFFIFENARYIATPLFLTLLLIETTDVIFAVDSIPAVLAITHDPFIVYTSNIFAILGLRSLYFVLSRMMVMFDYLHYSISFILVFVGVKMLLDDYYEVNNVVALVIIFGSLLIGILASLYLPKKK